MSISYNPYITRLSTAAGIKLKFSLFTHRWNVLIPRKRGSKPANPVSAVSLLAIVLLTGFSGVENAAATVLNRQVVNVVDTNPDPHVFEAELSADEQTASINGTEVDALIYKDVNRVGGYPAVSDGIPVPQIVVNVGDEVIVTLTNNFDDPCAAISCDTSIHWHGLELDNDSDGTGVTQNALLYGQSYTYRFIAPRPGVFWFHPHMKPGPQAFAGMYGAFIVLDPNEATLSLDDKIPAAADTHTIVLSDTEFNDDGDVGYFYNDDGDPNTDEVFERWAVLRADCGDSGVGAACKGVSRWQYRPGQRAGSGRRAAGHHGAFRNRHTIAAAGPFHQPLFSPGRRGQWPDDVTDNNLYRIGGEGGFLEFARLEGGTLGTWDTEYDPGEILLPASGRSDVVIVPTGNNGDIIRIVGREYHRGGPIGVAPAIGDLLHIQIDNSEPDPGTPFAIADGSEILGLAASKTSKVKSSPISIFRWTATPATSAIPATRPIRVMPMAPTTPKSACTAPASPDSYGSMAPLVILNTADPTTPRCRTRAPRVMPGPATCWNSPLPIKVPNTTRFTIMDFLFSLCV